MTVLAAVAVGAAVGGFVQGLAGFAFGLVAMPIWAFWVPPSLAGPMVVFGSLLGQVLSLGTVRQDFDGRRLAPFILGGVLGVPVGVLLLHRIDPVGFKLVVGFLLVLWCPAMLLARDFPRVTGGGRLADAVVGWLGGAMGGLGGLTGPAPTLWCALRGWDRDTQRAVFQTFNLIMQVLTMAAYIAWGTVTMETARAFMVIALAMLIPVLIGARLYRRFSNAGFRRAVLLLLTASGAVLVLSACLALR
ncbi:MAG TPA: sulfite exporter TauE/SafE family protein [Acetobacteraceae bacterium]|nr:sulfite exporter TauE/SafE family protein [Acetobacteraceae bacterium]